MRPKIVFCRTRSDIPLGAVEMPFEYEDRKVIIKAFNERKIQVLAVPRSMVTGWRSDFYEDECDVEFLGEGWSETEIIQGKARIIPTLMRGI